MDPTVQYVLAQAFAKSHEDWLQEASRENQAAGNVQQQTQLSFLEAKEAYDLAEGILNQRSASQQPQIGVIPAAPGISQLASKA